MKIVRRRRVPSESQIQIGDNRSATSPQFRPHKMIDDDAFLRNYHTTHQRWRICFKLTSHPHAENTFRIWSASRSRRKEIQTVLRNLHKLSNRSTNDSEILCQTSYGRALVAGAHAFLVSRQERQRDDDDDDVRHR